MAVASNRQRLPAGMPETREPIPLRRARMPPGEPTYKDYRGIERRRSFTDFVRTIRETTELGQASYEANVAIEKVYRSGRGSFSPAVRKTAMGETSGQVGGYLVPLDYTYELMRVIAEESFIYPRATVLPMSEPIMDCPVVDVTTAPALNSGISPFFGSMQFKWGFSQAPAETEPKFQNVNLTAWDLLGYTVISNQLLWDMGGPSYESSMATNTYGGGYSLGENALFNLFGKAAAWFAEYAFLSGTGADNSMPVGVINAPCTIQLARTVANQIAAADLSGLAANMLPFGWRHAIWACSPDCLAQIMKATTFFVNADGIEGDRDGAGGFAGRLIGRPLYVTEKLPPLGTPGDLVFFDPSLYVIGNRQEVLIDVSSHVSFPTNQTNYRIWLRLDGKPMVSKPITLQDGITTVSPCTCLK